MSPLRRTTRRRVLPLSLAVLPILLLLVVPAASSHHHAARGPSSGCLNFAPPPPKHACPIPPQTRVIGGQAQSTVWPRQQPRWASSSSLSSSSSSEGVAMPSSSSSSSSPPWPPSPSSSTAGVGASSSSGGSPSFVEGHGDASSSHSPFVQELLTQGVLKIVKRPLDYEEKRKAGYQEPQEMYLLGTAHTSEASAKAVQRLIHEVRPDAVVVELCKSRSSLVALNSSSLLDQDLPSILGLTTTLLKGRGGKQGGAEQQQEEEEEALQRSVRLAGGRGPLVLQYLLAWSVRALAQKLRITFGNEFKAAKEAATQVGATVVLGDRPIEMTMRRAWASMRPEERGALLVAALALLVNIRDLVAKEAATRKTKKGGSYDVDSQQDKAPPFSSPSPLSELLSASDGGAAAVDRSSQVLRLLQQQPQQPPLQPEAQTPAAAAPPPAAAGAPDDSSSSSADPSSSSSSSSSSVFAMVEGGGMGQSSREALQAFFPGLYAALIAERDAYLAWAIKRSKAVNGSKRVVAVMGLLHLAGVEHHIRHDKAGDRLRFTTVARLPDPPSSSPAAPPLRLTPEHALLVQQTAKLWLRNKGPGMLTSLAVGTALGQLLNLLGPSLLEALGGGEGGWGMGGGGPLF